MGRGPRTAVAVGQAGAAGAHARAHVHDAAARALGGRGRVCRRRRPGAGLVARRRGRGRGRPQAVAAGRRLGHGDADPRRGDAAGPGGRLLLVPALPRHAVAAAGRPSPGGAPAPRAHRRADRGCRTRRARVARGTGRGRGRGARPARPVARAAARLPRRAGAALPPRPARLQPRRSRLRLGVLHAARAAPCARGGRRAAERLPARAPRRRTDLLPRDRPSRGRRLLVLRRSARRARRPDPGVAVAMSMRRASLLMWVGLWAAPLAWAAQHMAGVMLGLARCSPNGRRWEIPLATWAALFAGLAALIAIAGIVAAIVAFRETRELSEAGPPGSRIHFLAAMALAVGPLFLAIIILNGLGASLVDTCRPA